MSGAHAGKPGRFLALRLTLLKRFTPAGHLTTSAWLWNKYCFRRFLLQGVNSSFELLAAAGRLVHTQSWEEREVYLFYFTVERGRREKRREMRIEKEGEAQGKLMQRWLTCSLDLAP